MIRRLLSCLALTALCAASLPAAEEKPAAAEAAAATTAEKPAKPKKKTEAGKTEKKADKATSPDGAANKAAQKTPGEKAAAKLTPTQTARLLDLLNTGELNALQAMPEIGEAKAKAIQKARPVKAVADLLEIEGIGETTFEQIIAWAKKGMKTETAKPEEAKKKESKPAAKSKPKDKTSKETPKPANEVKKGEL